MENQRKWIKNREFPCNAHEEVGNSSPEFWLYKQCAIRVRMCSASEDMQYKRGCAVRIRHIVSTSKDVQYKQVDNQVLVQEGST